MTPSDRTRTAQARSIFEEASEHTPRERESFLAEACGGDDALRAEVESLLRAADRAGAFLSAPQVPARPPTDGAVGLPPLMAESLTSGRTSRGAAAEVEGSTVGRYKLREQIGEGGFGAVFLAEQERPVRRRVALKIIKPGMDSRQVVARFGAERQALALMDHPGIARVFDGGTTDAGRAYFVMELVEGPPITAYCDATKLLLRGRLELFARVCDAVHHAHQKGVIHRDLKPSNVLVAERDGRPVPKVIDFGVAKAVQGRLAEHSLHTEQRQLVGTPEYMSPEQAAMGAAAVDARSDVYSLGVLLYELLVGVTPFDARELRSKSVGEVERILREVEPPPPSERLAAMDAAAVAAAAAARGAEPAGLRRLLRGEPDWVAMRCLEKDPARRYESAAALAADVRRHLSGEAVLARPTTALYRLRKFAGRHKAGVAAGAAVAAAMLLGVAGTTVGMLRARAAEQQARTDKAAAEREAGRASAANRFIREVLSGANPEIPGGGREVKVVDRLDAAAASLGERFRGQPEAEIDVRLTIGAAYSALDLHKEADEVLAPAYAMARERFGPDGRTTLVLAAAWARALNGTSAGTSTGCGRAEDLLRESIEAARRTLGDRDPLTLRLEVRLGQSLNFQYRLAEYEAVLRSVLPRLPDPPPDIDAARMVFEAHSDYSNAASLNLRISESEEHKRKAEAVYRKYLGGRSWHSEGGLAQSLYRRNRLRESAEAHRSVLDFVRPRLGVGHWGFWMTSMQYASVLKELGRFDDAMAVWQELLDLASSRQDGELVGERAWRVAELLWRAGRTREADAMAERAITAYAASPAGDPPDGKLGSWRLQRAIRSGVGSEMDWANPGLFSGAWRALVDVLSADGAAPDWGRVRFSLARWVGNRASGPVSRPGTGPSAPAAEPPPGADPIAAGEWPALRAVGPLPPGLYRLWLEVPLGDGELRRVEAWVPLWPWEVLHYRPASSFPREHWRERVLSTDFRPEPYTLPSLTLSDGLTLRTGLWGKDGDFGLIATSGIELPPGRYRFSLTSDDGSCLFVGGKQVIYHWMLHPATTKSATVELPAGPHELRVEYFQGGGGHALWLDVVPEPADPTPEGPAPFSSPDAHREFALVGRAPEERPDDAAAWAARGNLMARRGRFTEALDDYLKAVELDAGRQRGHIHRAATLRLALGDSAGFSRDRQPLLDRYAGEQDPLKCYEIAAAHLLASGASTPHDLEACRKLVAQTVAGTRNAGTFYSYAVLLTGASSYRAGDYAGAVATLEPLPVVGRSAASETRVAARLFLAMAHHHLGRAEKARNYLDLAVRTIEEDLGKPGEDDLAGWRGEWMDWVHCQVLRREAEAVVRGTAAACP